MAASEPDRLASFGKIHWREEDSRPPDLCVCPSYLIAKPDKVGVVRHWSSWRYPLNSVLVNTPVMYGAMDEFLQLFSPGAYVGGIDLQDHFLRCLVSLSFRRNLGVRRPVSGVLGVYLLLPFGSGPSPGWNDY